MIKQNQCSYFFIFLFLFMPVYNSAKIITNRVIATIGVGDTPAGIAVTPDNRFAYVANNNNDGLIVCKFINI